MRLKALNRHSPVPLFVQLEDCLRERIKAGEWSPGETIPSERELSAQYGVSRQTLGLALRGLIQEGLLVTIRGKGIQIAKPKFKENLTGNLNFMSYFDVLVSKGYKPGAQLLAFETGPAGAKVAEKLRVTPHTRIVRLKRLRLLNDEPVIILVNHIPAKLVPGIRPEDCLDSLTHCLRTQYGLECVLSHRSLELVYANPQESELLQIPRRAPCFLVEGVSYTQDGLIMEYWTAVVKGDVYRVEFEVRKDNKVVVDRENRRDGEDKRR